ncbi:unnamed protein product, partial [Closterium sp. NIES-54]
MKYRRRQTRRTRTKEGSTKVSEGNRGRGTRDEHEESGAKAKCEKEEGTTRAEEEGKQLGRGQEEEAEDQRWEERGGREEKERGDRGSEDQRQEEEVAAATAPAAAVTAAPLAAAAAAAPAAAAAATARHPKRFPSLAKRVTRCDGRQSLVSPVHASKDPATVRDTGSKLTDSILGRETENVRDLFNFGRELGRGQFGVTYVCTEKRTGLQYACKLISKKQLITSSDVEDIKREIAILHLLSDHPNVINLKGAYKDDSAVYIVMELCTGGELFDQIIARGHYSERAAAEVVRVIVSVVRYCHANYVIHRDLKPENFLVSSEEEGAPLKAVDFGLSAFYRPGHPLHTVAGSAFYMAPEVIRGSYGPEADLWSVGVVLYILLSGSPPFWG